jgi:2,3-bisphosphoglycerate-dependent phosphoglycerate mutase
MKCYYIRHGQSANNLLYDTTGSNVGRSDDPPLTPLGIEQARRAAAYICHESDRGNGNGGIKGFGITHIYSSLMIRAIATATEISKATNVPVVAWEELHEQGGIYLDDPVSGETVGCPGKKGEELLHLFPDLILPDGKSYSNGWWNNKFHETKDEAIERARGVVEVLRMRHNNTRDHVLLVSHAAFYNCFIEVLMGINTQNGHWFSLNNTGISRFDFEIDYVDLIFHNQVCFLDSNQIT